MNDGGLTPGAAIKDIQKAIQLQPNEPGYKVDMEKIKALLTSTIQGRHSTDPH